MKNMLLEEIVFYKKEELARKEKALPLNVLIDDLTGMENPRGFERCLRGGPIAVIAEIKRASPVKGVLREDFNPLSLAATYEKYGARAISVITEERYFKGNPDYLAAVKEASWLPVLRKDFIVSEYQVYESRCLGADAVLLIASLLEETFLRHLLEIAASLGMEALVEVHHYVELQRALAAGARVIGINNRDLKSFCVNLSTTTDLVDAAPAEVLLVSESGINCRNDLLILEEAGVEAVLIGEALVRSPNPGDKLSELLGQPEAEKEGNELDHVDQNMRD